MKNLIFTLLLIIQVFVVLSSTAVNDLSLHQLTPAGDVRQLSYAAKMIDRSTLPALAVNICDGKCILLMAIKKVALKIEVVNNEDLKIIECMGSRSTRVNIAFGFSPDGIYLRKQLFTLIESHRGTYGESPTAKHLSSQIADG